MYVYIIVSHIILCIVIYCKIHFKVRYVCQYILISLKKKMYFTVHYKFLTIMIVA